MILKTLTNIFGSSNDRILRGYQHHVTKINALESGLLKQSDTELQQQSAELRQQMDNGRSMEDALAEAFALVREASKRTLKMRHFDVQLIGGIALHKGKIAEMRTGEGKTLVATLPVFLNAISGKGVHVVTVNDYLAQRDADWMGKLYHFLGLSVGVNLVQMSRAEKQQAYAAHVTYGTNNEFGFDYLRDNMVESIDNRVQRSLSFAIVDEVDSILIDEARTPLIISGQAEDNTELYRQVNVIAPLLDKQVGEADPRTGEGVITPGDFIMDEKSRQVHLTEAGHEKVEKIFEQHGLLSTGTSLYDASNIVLIHHLYAALRAHHLFFRDQHYVVQEGEVIIVDEFTGRLMIGRRWSDGLHQAIEAKEGVKIQVENQTLASITFQNYFRLYDKLSGMTGTADTEAYEFHQIYGLETVIIPTNRPLLRKDYNDQVYKTSVERYNAVVTDIRNCHERGQPTLVGTASIESSEFLSNLLQKAKLPHEVLNAKQHVREAQIIAQAGKPGSITIATNMAGRGTDIVLGGNLEKEIEAIQSDEKLDDTKKTVAIAAAEKAWDERHEQVVQAGGLHIIGTERHESRRIDNQLRGRAARQGDPGSSRFYLSLDDALMRIFAGQKVKVIMERLKIPDNEPIEAGIVSRSIETAQRKVEAHNFDIRKQLLEFDDVANEQRKVIYTQRTEILKSQDLTPLIENLRQGAIRDFVQQYVPEQSVEEQWNLSELEQKLLSDWGISLELRNWVESHERISSEDIQAHCVETVDTYYQQKLAPVSRDAFMQFERAVLLQVIDYKWREHLSTLDYLRQGIHLRGYAQKNPKQEYKREAFALFAVMLDVVRDTVTRVLVTARLNTEDEAHKAAEAMEAQNRLTHVQYDHATINEAQEENPIEVKPEPIKRPTPKVGRNEPCPCGSGKKYKHCHGVVR